MGGRIKVVSYEKRDVTRLSGRDEATVSMIEFLIDRL